MDDEFALLTYDEIAERFGIARESARQLVIRKRWGRRKGNDGRARIEVPFDALPSSTSVRPSESTVDDTSDEAFDMTSDLAELTRTLNRHIERLEQALATSDKKALALLAERDKARDEARAIERDRDAANENLRIVTMELAGLRTLMEVEKKFLELERSAANEAKAERDRWHALAARPWWRRLTG